MSQSPFQHTGSLNVGNNATTTSMGIAAGVFSEEELDSMTVDNAKGATIRGVGKQAFAIYNRAEEFVLTNAGTIENAAGRGNGVAIGAVSDSGKVSSFEFTNTGTVKGDIVRLAFTPNAGGCCRKVRVKATSPPVMSWVASRSTIA